MVDKERAREKLAKLLNSFPRHPEYNEENLKFNYIEPLLMEIFGWNRADIIKEQRVLKGRADYILKIGNEEVLVIETKRPSVSLSEEEGRQAVSYAYHRKIKFAVLTNFKEIKVYHALSNIKNIENNLLKFEDSGLFRIPLEQFLDKFDKLFLLSKESFEKGEINKLLSKKDEKLAKPIDESILDDLLEIRRKLSNDLKHLRMHLTQEQIDEAVQILIDRLIFMRSAEDRGLEPMNFLLGIRKDYREGRLRKRLWDEFLELFTKFDKEYNSKLFAKGLLEDEAIFFSDDALQKIIYTLYFGNEGDQTRYKFDEIPGDLLGSIYEQYLGTVLQGTEKRVKLESKTGKRKKMGIYYTPSYIVDYIIKNTVGEYIKNKTIDEILDVRIIDPACGSGSFLTRAFQEVAFAVEERLKKGEKAKNYQAFQSYNGRLSLGQKATILLNCIYGVDLDEKAVELAQLNLLLKLLEDETPETKRRLLPNMKDNIKNGNSLIDDSKIAGDKAFKWQAQFPDVFRGGGFDVVVGNPPYGADLKDEEKKFLRKEFNQDKTGNTASFFIFLGLNVLKNEGYFSYIVPKQLTYITSWNGTRKNLLNASITHLIDASEAFQDVELEQIIFVIKKDKKASNKVIVGFSNKGQILEDFSNMKYFNEIKFPLWITDKNYSIFEKILKDSVQLQEIAKVNWGGMVARYLSKNKTSDSIPCLRGREIGRYYVTSEYFIKKKDIDKSYYVKGEKLLFQRIVSRYGEKLIANYRNARIVGTYANDEYYADKTVTLLWGSKLNLKFLLGIFNSKLINWFAHRYLWNRSQLTMEFMYEYARNFPVRLPNHNQEQKIVELVDQMLSLQKQLHEKNLSGNEKERLEQQIKNIDYEIDQEVYKLYGLTEEEIKIIEESLR